MVLMNQNVESRVETVTGIHDRRWRDRAVVCGWADSQLVVQVGDQWWRVPEGTSIEEM